MHITITYESYLCGFNILFVRGQGHINTPPRNKQRSIYLGSVTAMNSQASPDPNNVLHLEATLCNTGLTSAYYLLQILYK